MFGRLKGMGIDCHNDHHYIEINGLHTWIHGKVGMSQCTITISIHSYVMHNVCHTWSSTCAHMTRMYTHVHTCTHTYQHVHGHTHAYCTHITCMNGNSNRLIESNYQTNSMSECLNLSVGEIQSISVTNSQHVCESNFPSYTHPQTGASA